MTETTESPRATAETIAALPAYAAAHFARRPASRHLEGGEWVQTSYARTCAAIEEIALGLIALGIAPGDRVGILCDTRPYLFLPLAHIFAQSTMLASLFIGTAIVYYGGDTREILPELMATHPSYLPAVPRIIEKLYTAAMKLRDAGDEEERARFDRAVEVGVAVRRLRERGEPVPAELQEPLDRAEESLYARVRALFGGRIERALSAAAPIAPRSSSSSTPAGSMCSRRGA